MIRITIYAGLGEDKTEGEAPHFYEPSVTARTCAEADVHEELRQIGLEWRTADYFPTRQTMIVLDPVPDEPPSMAAVQSKIRAAAASLEGTGLL